MSDHIPLDIQSEIIKRLPVKSVVQCRSVSKEWKSLIDSSKFIKSYHSCKSHLFVKYWSLSNELKFASIVDDDTFPNQISPLTIPNHLFLYTLTLANGLFCFYGPRKNAIEKNDMIAVLWNPSLRKEIGIPISNPVRPSDGYTYVGFGVCPNTNDPKLVRINIIGKPTMNWEVEVFTLSTRVWETVSNIPPAFKTCDLTLHPVFFDGFIYWRAYHKIRLTRTRPHLIISFDLKSYEFGEVCLPDGLEHIYALHSNVYESLGFFDYYYDDAKTKFCDVWIMKEGVTKSFTKMLSIKVPERVYYRVLQLRKNGEVIIETTDDISSSILEVYEPSLGQINGVGLNGRSYSVSSYMETLLLLDESNSIIEEDDKV